MNAYFLVIILRYNLLVFGKSDILVRCGSKIIDSKNLSKFSQRKVYKGSLILAIVIAELVPNSKTTIKQHYVLLSRVNEPISR